MTTLLNRFQRAATHLKQKHVVLVGDLPLYIRTKELRWENLERYDNVIVLMGRLHIFFNFLKSIGQQVECAGLDDIWVEAGIFASNSTYAVMEGKAYYRAVRGNMLAFETHHRVKWDPFRGYVGDRYPAEVDEQASIIHDLFQEKDANDEISQAEVKKLSDILLLPEIADLSTLTQTTKFGRPIWSLLG